MCNLITLNIVAQVNHHIISIVLEIIIYFLPRKEVFGLVIIVLYVYCPAMSHRISVLQSTLECNISVSYKDQPH